MSGRLYRFPPAIYVKTIRFPDLGYLPPQIGDTVFEVEVAGSEDRETERAEEAAVGKELCACG